MGKHVEYIQLNHEHLRGEFEGLDLLLIDVDIDRPLHILVGFFYFEFGKIRSKYFLRLL